MLRKIVILCCVLCSVANAAQVIRYVNTDSTAGGDGTTNATTGDNRAYDCLQNGLTAEATDLDTANNYMTVYCSSPSGVADTNAVTITGWTTSSDDYIEIIQTDMPADGKRDFNEYVLQVSGTSALNISEEYVRVKLQIQSVNSNCIYVPSGVGTSYIRVYDSILVGSSPEQGINRGIRTNDSSVVIDIFNTVLMDFIYEDDSDYFGIYLDTVGTANIYNCTIYNCYYGINQDIGTVNVYNCVVFNCTDDFQGSFNAIDYCASDDGDGTNGVDWDAGATDWAAAFTDYTTLDFSVKDTDSDLYDAGTPDPGSGLYSDDIIGTTRSTWDIGAFEYVSQGAAPTVKGRINIVNMN